MTFASPSRVFTKKFGDIAGWNIGDVAMGEESGVIYREYKISLNHFLTPISTQWANPVTRFLILKARWEAETAVLSSVSEIAMHPAYQQIIGMGHIAIPLILAEIREKPGHWFWALKSITGEDPVVPEQRGRMKEMTEAWLCWGKKQGYNK